MSHFCQRMRLRIFSSSSKLNTDTRLPSVSLQHRYWPYVWFVQHPAVSLALLSLQINKFFKFSIHSPLCNHAGNKGPPPSTPPVDIFIFYFGAKKKKKGAGGWRGKKSFSLKRGLHSGRAGSSVRSKSGCIGTRLHLPQFSPCSLEVT